MNATPAAVFVAFLGGGVLIAIGASFGFWLVDRVSAHFERTETLDLTPLEDYAALREAMTRHPAKGEQS